MAARSTSLEVEGAHQGRGRGGRRRGRRSQACPGGAGCPPGCCPRAHGRQAAGRPGRQGGPGRPTPRLRRRAQIVMTRRRVAVTGLGALCALGSGIRALERGLREARCALAPLDHPEVADLAGLPFGAVGDFDVPIARAHLRRSSRADRLALAAALEAAADAALPISVQAQAAVVLGVGAGGLDALERYVRTHDSAGPGRAHPSDLVTFPPAGSSRAVAQAVGAGGPCLALMTACSSSATALGHAFDLVRRGRVPVAFAGGTEPRSRLTLSGFLALRALAPEPCRPFDANRRGLSLGEG